MILARAIPASALLHGAAFAALLLWGDRVTTQTASLPRAISVRLVGPPAARAQSAPPAARGEPLVEPEQKPDVEPARPDVPRPAKQLPREKPKSEAKAKPKPSAGQPTGKTAAPSTTAGAGKPGAAAGATAGLSGSAAGGSAVSGTDGDFPFAYYLQAVEGKIVANWKPRQLGFGQRAVVSCSVHFVVNRSGVVSQVRLVRNSGLGVYDREAVRAVTTTRLPPLPPQYRGSELGITFDFNLEPGAQ